MTTAFYDIEVAFQTTLNNISNKPFIEFENLEPYKRSLDVRFWRTTNMPTNTVQVTTDGLRMHTGVYKVDIITTVGKGMKDMLQDMDAIASVFDTVTSIVSNNTKVQINGVSRSMVNREESVLYGFVKILYTCYSY
jgi:hypothetical protein